MLLSSPLSAFSATVFGLCGIGFSRTEDFSFILFRLSSLLDVGCFTEESCFRRRLSSNEGRYSSAVGGTILVAVLL
uniref:Putative secreted protein n=1 Tax=Anopheles darlingi TaxID=43151 RepID=A0A2M4DGG6_ANODA